MGAWGVKIYQDDVACDVKEEYVEALKKGISNEEITEKLIAEYVGDIDDEPIFWFALADIQWNYGRLLDNVKEQSLKHIANGANLERWEENPKLYEKRKKVLEELKEKLNTSQPPEKKVKGYGKPYKCEWAIGDVFAYPLKSEEAKEAGFEGQYLIIIKVGETKWYPEHVIPVVKFKVTKNGKVPETIDEINKLEYVQTGIYTYYHGTPVTLEIFKMPKDEYGLIPFYIVGMITTSKRVIPKDLKYIGNFNNRIISPKIELIDQKNSILGIASGKYIFWKDLEQQIIEAYRLCNLRESEIYQPDYWEKQGIDREAMDKRIEEYFKSKGLL